MEITVKCTHVAHPARNPRNAGFEHLEGLWFDDILYVVEGATRTPEGLCAGCSKQDGLEAESVPLAKSVEERLVEIEKAPVELLRVVEELKERIRILESVKVVTEIVEK